MTDNTRRNFLKKAAAGLAVAATYPTARVLGANDRIRVGMIGPGARGQELLSQLLKLPEAQLVAVADIYSRRRDEVKKLVPGVEALDDHRRLLDRKDIDCEIEASPLQNQARHFLDTLSPGKEL